MEGRRKDARGDTIGRSSCVCLKDGRLGRQTGLGSSTAMDYVPAMSSDRAVFEWFPPDKKIPSDEGGAGTTRGPSCAGMAWWCGLRDVIGRVARPVHVLARRPRPCLPRQLHAKLSAGSSVRPTAASRSPALRAAARSCAVRHWDRWRDRRASGSGSCCSGWAYHTPAQGAATDRARAIGRRNVAERGQATRPACATP